MARIQPSSTQPQTVPQAHSSLIADAHLRSRAFGLQRQRSPELDPASKVDLQQQIDGNHDLFTLALPAMEMLYGQIANTHSMVMLTNHDGLILHALGDDDFLEKADRVALRPGSTWSESSRGTNAIGTALAEAQPVLVHADEHFLLANRFLTCSCAPILDPYGHVAGALDVSGDQRSYQQHTMALVRMSAQMIENHLFTHAFADTVRVHFHTRPEFIGTLMEGMAAFSVDGRFLSANRSGQFQLGMSLTGLASHTFPSLFGLPTSSLMDHIRRTDPELLTLCLHNGVRVSARVEFSPRQVRLQPRAEPVASRDAQLTTVTAAASVRRPHKQFSGLRYLNTGDPQLLRCINRIEKVLGRDIPIMILGETGTGKELLAQAIHQDSPQHDGPFVAVNCASIPEHLIESELFGYHEGAFTGARKQGQVGKILQANGGTLFLDEIGDMPVAMQARLLRVLQERSVSPLGGGDAIEVSFNLVCATHRNLRDLIARGDFREDLYYRINGLTVTLPPLRTRTDLEVIIERFLQGQSRETRRVSPLKLAPEVMQAFQSYAWPGNVRQLVNLLRTACVMAEQKSQIERNDLPDDFLDDLDNVPPSASISASSAPLDHASTALRELTLDAIRQAWQTYDGNVTATARALGISRNTLYRRLRELASDKEH